MTIETYLNKQRRQSFGPPFFILKRDKCEPSLLLTTRKIPIIKKTEKGHRPFSVIFIDYERESAVTETFAHGFGTS